MNESIQSIPNDDTWDAGDLGCGPLLIQLRKRLLAMPGHVLRLNATDAGAPEDIPSYCRMTGHVLVEADPARHTWWIRARPAPPSADQASPPVR